MQDKKEVDSASQDSTLLPFTALWLSRAACLAILVAMAGCDAFYHVRMDVRQGDHPGTRVVSLLTLDQIEGAAIEGAQVDLRPSWSRVQAQRLQSDADGTVRAEFTVGGFIWQKKEFDTLRVGLTCTAKGYMPVRGTFQLKDFSGVRHTHTVLISMPPASSAGNVP